MKTNVEVHADLFSFEWNFLELCWNEVNFLTEAEFFYSFENCSQNNHRMLILRHRSLIERLFNPVKEYNRLLEMTIKLVRLG